MSDEQRRQAVRVKLRLMVFMKCVGTRKVLRVLTKNISGIGMALVTEGTLEPDTKLELEITLPDRKMPILCEARVVWSKPTGEPHKSYAAPPSETGVKFVSIDPKDQAQLLQYARLNAFQDAP